MTEGWFWSSPGWQRYMLAKGGSPDIHVGAANLVAPLGPEPEMWARVRHGHQADIRSAQHRGMRVERSRDFAVYEHLHRASAKLPRDQRTYDHMWTFLNDGHAQLYLAHERKWVGAALFFVYERGSYYASVARCSDEPRGTGHLLLWTAMRELAQDGIAWMDFGPADASTDKEKAIEHFKRGFGAEPRAGWRWGEA
ncbi:MAG: GNAT family N-acetyltransferase [Gemmatimonadaceae bacterium]|nr:GNAT family N-acetyltransferase [Gemmatimonadaceae bacterium]